MGGAIFKASELTAVDGIPLECTECPRCGEMVSNSCNRPYALWNTPAYFDDGRHLVYQDGLPIKPDVWCLGLRRDSWRRGLWLRLLRWVAS
jgi:hypothetical protein